MSVPRALLPISRPGRIGDSTLPRRPLVVASLVLFACTERPLGATETGTANATTSAPAPGTTIEPTTAVSPVSTTGTGDASVGATLDIKLDLFDPDPSLVDCILDAPPGTMLAGTTSLGPFTAQRAYFGWIAHNGVPFQPVLLFVSPEADPAVEVLHSNGSSGAIFHGDVGTDSFDEGWVGQWFGHFDVFDQGQVSDALGPSMIAIDALVGDWSELDPADPPRLVGSVQGPIAGPFDAVFCDELNEMIIVE